MRERMCLFKEQGIGFQNSGQTSCIFDGDSRVTTYEMNGLYRFKFGSSGTNGLEGQGQSREGQSMGAFSFEYVFECTKGKKHLAP